MAKGVTDHYLCYVVWQSLFFFLISSKVLLSSSAIYSWRSCRTVRIQESCHDSCLRNPLVRYSPVGNWTRELPTKSGALRATSRTFRQAGTGFCCCFQRASGSVNQTSWLVYCHAMTRNLEFFLFSANSQYGIFLKPFGSKQTDIINWGHFKNHPFNR